ncbi:MAG: biotin synthase [Planctomycetota bacterium]|jgi:biotin synthase
MKWNNLADQVLRGEPLTFEDAWSILDSGDDELLEVLQAAFRVRKRQAGMKVRVHVLQNAKSGACPEDCTFCTQSVHYQTESDTYPRQDVEELIAGAKRAVEMGAVTYCMVTATRGPSGADLETICQAARAIKAEHPIKLCASLGLLKADEAEALAAAGIDRYNHNLETSPDHFAKVCTTHDFTDRVNTVKAARAAGMEACCGGIMGMGEGFKDRIDLAFTLRELGVESIPLNFLNARPGTPMEEAAPVSPQDALRTLALVRLANPDAIDIRLAGGREVVLGSMQPLALYAANSIFTNGYLTTEGQAPSEDLAMIQNAGFAAEVLEA